MELRVVIEQTLRFDRGVNLRRGNARVAEHFLDRAQVGAAREQVGGERMSQRMGFHIFRDTGALRVRFHDFP